MNVAGEVNEDFVDMLTALIDGQVDFLIVGAYALAAHGYPRATGDIDILVAPTVSNAARVYGALLEFGAPVSAHGVTAKDFEVKGSVYQIGLPPRRIDVLTSISGVEYDEAARARRGKWLRHAVSPRSRVGGRRARESCGRVGARVPA